MVKIGKGVLLNGEMVIIIDFLVAYVCFDGVQIYFVGEGMFFFKYYSYIWCWFNIMKGKEYQRLLQLGSIWVIVFYDS